MKLLIVVGIVTSLILNVTSLYLHTTTDFLVPSSTTTTSTSIWLTSIILFLVLMYILEKKRAQKHNDNFSKHEVLGVVLIVLIAIILRVYKITHQGLNLDEWYWLTQAKEIVNGTWISPFGFIGDQPSNMPVYIVAFFYTLFRDNYLASRLPGIVYSIGTIFFVFLFLKNAFSKKIAWIGLLLLSASIWDIHNSQIGLQNVTINPFIISGMWYFGYIGFKRNSLFLICLCGIFCGISINLLYIASLSMFPIFIYAVFLYFRKKSKNTLLIGLILCTSLFLTSSPTIPKIFRYQETSIGRHQQFVNQTDDDKNIHSQRDIQFYITQLLDALNDFTYQKAKFGVNYLWGVTLDPLILGVCVLGLIYVLKHICQEKMILIFMQFIIMFIPIVVFYKATSVWREYGFIPSIYILSALGFGFIEQLLSSYQQTFRNIVIGSIIICSVILSSYLYTIQFLVNEPDTLETYCKHTMNSIQAHISPDTVIVLPNELCALYISIFIDNVYTIVEYDSFKEVSQYKNRYKNIAVIKIIDNAYSSNFQKKYSFINFNNIILNQYPQTLIHPINLYGKMKAVIYQM